MGSSVTGFISLAGSISDDLISFHPTYLALGHSFEERQTRYAQWVQGELEEIDELKFSEANYLGSGGVWREIEATCG